MGNFPKATQSVAVVRQDLVLPGSLVPESKDSVTQLGWSPRGRHHESDLWTHLPTPTGLVSLGGWAGHLCREQPGKWPQRLRGVWSRIQLWSCPLVTLVRPARLSEPLLTWARGIIKPARHIHTLLGQRRTHPAQGWAHSGLHLRDDSGAAGSLPGARLTSWAQQASGLHPARPQPPVLQA